MKIWGISEGRRGHDVKIEGLAQALLKNVPDGALQMIHTQLPLPARLLAPFLPAVWQAARDPKIAPPYPDLVLACGRRTVPYARHIRRTANGKCFVAFLDHPRINPRHFDFVWAPTHDRLNAPNVMNTLISPHNLTNESLAAAARRQKSRLLPQGFSGEVVSVLIGGPNSAFDFTPIQMANLAQKLTTIATPKRFLLITLSRRSPPAYADALRATLPEGRYFLWDNQADNPYQAMLGLADYVVVTADSVNMLGEACSIGKPVYLFQLPGRARKFGRFHRAMIDEGLVYPFAGRLDKRPAKSINPTPEIATAIKNAMRQKQR